MPLRFQGVDPETQGYRILDEEAGEEMLWPPGIPEVENSVAMLQQEEEDRRLAMGGDGGGVDVSLNPSFVQEGPPQVPETATDAQPRFAPPEQVPTMAEEDPTVAAAMQGQNAPARQGQTVVEQPAVQPARPQPQGQPGPVQAAQMAGIERPDPSQYVSATASRPATIGGRDPETVRAETQDIMSGQEAAAVYRQQLTEMARDAHQLARDEAQENISDARIDAQLREQKAQDRVQERMTQAESVRSRVRDMAVDPNRFWKEKGTGTQILAALMMGLGEFASQMTGGPNTAKTIIDTAIQRDIDQQLMDIERGDLEVEDAENAVGMAYRQLGDLREARQVAMASAYDHAARMVEEAAQDNAYLMQRADFADTLASLKEEGQKRMFQLASMYEAGQQGGRYFDRAAYEKATDKYLDRVKQVQGIAKGQLEIEQGQRELSDQAAPGVDYDELEKYQKRLEKSGYYDLDETLKEVDRVVPASGNIPGVGLGYEALEGLTKAAGIEGVGKTTANLLAGEDGRKARQALKGLMVGQAKQMLKGVLSDQDLKLAEQVSKGFGTDDDYRYTINKLRQVRDQLGADLAASTDPKVRQAFEERAGRPAVGAGGVPDIRRFAR